MIIAIIPAKKRSTRLINKNLRLINRKPLLYWTAKYAKESKKIDRIYVSSDSKSTLRYSKKIGLRTILRPKKLTGETPILDVYKHAYKKIKKYINVSAIVGLQPDHPDRNLKLDSVIKNFLKKKCDFLFSVDKKKKKNGAHYILSKKLLLGGKIQKKIKVIDDCTNIHFLKDLKISEKNLKKNEKKN